MKYVLILAAFVSVLSFASCNKKLGSAKACFSFSKNPAKINDTVYLLNCSENYSKFKWMSSAFMPDSIHKHYYIVPTSIGNYPVHLLVYGLGDNATDTTGSVQFLSVK